MWTKQKPAERDLDLLDDARFEGANIIDRVETVAGGAAGGARPHRATGGQTIMTEQTQTERLGGIVTAINRAVRSRTLRPR